jgi:nicotinamide mononucleotide transporter PnuC
MERKIKLEEYIPLIVSFISIIVCSIIFKQHVIKTIPVCISLVVALLNSRANRVCYLIGATNCLIYIIGYFMERLYGSMLQSTFSCVMQLFTFLYWKKNSYKKATMFKQMSALKRLLLVIILIVSMAICTIILKYFNAQEAFLDSFTLVLGVVGQILTLFAFIEVLPIVVICQAISSVMWFKIAVQGSIADITYLIIYLYNLYMTIRMVKTWLTLYKEQRKLIKN